MRVHSMSGPFRSENASLEERLRRAEEELAIVAEDDAALAPRREVWQRENRKRRLALVGVVLGSIAMGSLTGFLAARDHVRRERRLEAENLEAKAHREDRGIEACHTMDARARGNLFGCLRVTERGLASRIDIHVYGEPLGSPVRRQLVFLPVAACSSPPFHTELTVEPSGRVSLVKLASLGRAALTSGETLCLDRVFRGATFGSWSGAPMLLTADYKSVP